MPDTVSLLETDLQWRGENDKRATLNGNSFGSRTKMLLKALAKGSQIKVKFANISTPVWFYRNRDAQPSYYSVDPMPSSMPRPQVGNYKRVHIEWVELPNGRRLVAAE